MLIKPNANSNLLKHYALSYIAALAIALLFLAPENSCASQTIILNVTLNQQNKGEFFVDFADNGDIRVKEADLLEMGFRGPFTQSTSIGGETYVSLKAIPGLTVNYNEKNLSLDLMALPEQLPARIIDFTPPQPLKVYYPRDSSAFLNYRLDYVTGESFAFKNFGLTNELGARYGDLLFLTDSAYQSGVNGDKFVRLMSSVVYDRRADQQRFTLGDMAVSSGDLGAGTIIGGIGLSKLYKMNPYLIYHPTLNFSGLATLPSEAEIFLDGMRIRTEQIAPGEFNLRNLTGYGGASQLEVVLKDSFGREQRINVPFYFTDALLKAGSHEYSYNFGALRDNLGVASNDYGKAAFSGFHWYGLRDDITLGFRGEGADSTVNLGPQGTFLIPRVGTLSLSLSGSNDRGKGGAAGLVAYNYQGKKTNARLQLKGFSKDYTTLALSQLDKKPQYAANAGFGYSTRELGSISCDLSSSKLYNEERLQTFSTTYSRSMFGTINLFVTYRRVMEPRAGDGFSIGLNYYPGNMINISTGYQQSSGSNSETVQIQKSLPVGEGTGFNVSTERNETSTAGVISSFKPALQYNSRYGTYAAEYAYQQSNSGSTDASRVSAAGSISWAGSTIGLTRPVTDSFALVKVGDVEGVRVYQNNQEIGKTNSSGTIFIPNLSAFNYNQISINDTDVPIDYQLTSKMIFTSPPYRSGSCVIFETAKLQAITGILHANIDGAMKPLIFKEVSLNLDDRTVTLQTGAGGEFYLDNYSLNQKNSDDGMGKGCQELGKTSSTLLKPGRYQGSVAHNGKACPVSLTIPVSSDPIIDLGTIICEGMLQETTTPEPVRQNHQPVTETLRTNKAEPPVAPPQPENSPGKEATPLAPNVPPASATSVSLDLEIYFAFDTARYSSKEDRAIVLTAARLLASNPSLQLIAIEGHTDQLGSVAYNMRLGKLRGETLADELMRGGVARDIIGKVTSFGKHQLKCSELDSDCCRLNRRGVIRIIQK